MVLPIVAYGNPILRRVCDEIDADYTDLQKLIADMWGVAMNVEEFLGELNQQYAARTVLESATQQGFAIE